MAFTRKHYTDRQRRLLRRMVAEDIDFFITMSSSRLKYLVGFTGSNGLLVMGGRRAEFLTDGRYREQARRQVRGARIHIVSSGLAAHLADLAEVTKGRPRIGYESQLFSMRDVSQLRCVLSNGLFVPVDEIMDPLMQIKDAEEISLIRKAAEIADDAFDHILTIIKPGVRERDVAAELEYSMKTSGSEKPAFDTIVASGARSALPHGIASSKRIRMGDFVTIDYGATVGGYVSDITRTIVVGKASARQRRVYDLVYRAQRAAVVKARQGVSCAVLDKVARGVISRAGHGKKFDHGLGHGIGLAVHEGPGINQRNSSTLKSGMVITIEPGVYFAGWGGVRIEDDVVIRPRGHMVLTTARRSLIEL